MSVTEIPKTRGDVLRILLVDDDAPLTEGLSAAIASQGYEVQVVNESAKAIEAARVFTPDLIVLDVMMPVIDGWQVLVDLRSDAALAGVPVIMLTAAGSEKSKIRGFTLGADDYLTKPFSVAELRHRIGAVLRRSKPDRPDETSASIPVVSSGSQFELVRSADVCYAEGIRNYTYIHTSDSRHLCRLTLGALEEKHIDRFSRVHRSYIVNLDHVKACGWVSKSAYHLRLDNSACTEIPVSRTLVCSIQQELGLRSSEHLEGADSDTDMRRRTKEGARDAR